MKTTTITAIILAAAWTIGYFAVTAPPAHCVYCSTVPCFSQSICGAGCSCMRSNDWEPGTCVQFN